MTAWIRQATGDDPAAIGESYALDGTVLDHGQSMAFPAPFAVAAMSVPGDSPGAQVWLDALWRKMAVTPPENDYADSIKLQVMMAMAGAWWSPAQRLECNDRSLGDELLIRLWRYQGGGKSLAAERAWIALASSAGGAAKA